MDKETSEIGREVDEKELTEEEEIEKQMYLEHRVFEEESKKIWLSKKRCTNVKTSGSVTFPARRAAHEKAELELRQKQWL